MYIHVMHTQGEDYNLMQCILAPLEKLSIHLDKRVTNKDKFRISSRVSYKMFSCV